MCDAGHLPATCAVVDMTDEGLHAALSALSAVYTRLLLQLDLVQGLNSFYTVLIYDIM
jgi:hypothetical protein